MEPTQAKPPRKRRRWLIVAFVLVLVSVAWWFWPRGDARFVGKWAAHEMGSAKPNFEMRLGVNGSATWTVHLPRVAPAPYHTEWRVEEERLVFGFKAPGPLEYAMMRTQAIFNGFRFGLMIGLNENPWDILSISEDTIELVSSPTRGKKREVTLTLRRIPE